MVGKPYLSWLRQSCRSSNHNRESTKVDNRELPAASHEYALTGSYSAFGIFGAEDNSTTTSSRGGIDAAKRLLTLRQFYLSISEAQFRVMDRGAALGSSTLVLIRNLPPSRVTS